MFTVTSSTVNEGKSSLVCNIAVCLSLLGYKVLIFDGDLRAPSIGRIFGIDKDELGYINTIEKGLPLDSVIVTPLSNNENLHVLLPGETTLNPSVFYAHTNYQESISYLRDKFDYIFIDSPPLGYASELLGLISYVDSIILCTRMSISNKKDLNSLISQLDDYKGKIGGIIASACALSSVYSYTSYSNYSRYYDYYYQNSGIDEDSNNYLFIKSERKAIKIFKKDIYKRRNRKK